MCETITVRRKDNHKIKILCVENFDPKKHEVLDEESKPKEKPKGKPKE